MTEQPAECDARVVVQRDDLRQLYEITVDYLCFYDPSSEEGQLLKRIEEALINESHEI